MRRRRATAPQADKQSGAPPDLLPVEVVALADLKPHPRNYRNHPPEQLVHIIASMRATGIYRNVVTARDLTVLAGHAVTEAARSAGVQQIRVVRLDLDPGEPRALAVLAADNEIGRLAEVDDRALTFVLREVMERGGGPHALVGTGFDAAQLAALVYVTRPRSEIEDVSAAAHWVGMPDFDPGDPVVELVVQFRDRESREKFVNEKGLEITDRKGNAWSTWWPGRPRDDLASVRWVDESAPPLLPRYPVFVPTRGRVGRQLTAKMFRSWGVPFTLVVEAQEADVHRAEWGEDSVLVLPESGKGLVYSRNFIRDHSRAAGHARHWQFDDDIRRMVRLHKGRRVTCSPAAALAVAEDLTDRYENVYLTSFNSLFFAPATGGIRHTVIPPMYVNSRCYTVFLVDNDMPHRWRGRYNEDTDMSLQVLAGGACSLLINAFLIDTPTTLTATGGQMTSPSGSYQGDGRLRMARELERRWPHVVRTIRRFQRPQHMVKDWWRGFDAPLVYREPAPAARDYRLRLEVLRPPKNAEMVDFVRSVS